jgi:hypothetical protein
LYIGTIDYSSFLCDPVSPGEPYLTFPRRSGPSYAVPVLDFHGIPIDVISGFHREVDDNFVRLGY